MEGGENLKNKRIMSFYSFLSDNYELSQFVLPKKKPADDSIDDELLDRLKELMNDKDFYEINRIIRKRYTAN